MNDLSKLTATRYMFEWFSKDPFRQIIQDAEKVLSDRVDGTVILSFNVTSKPQWLTVARDHDSDGSAVIVVRAGVAFEFEAEISIDSRERYILKGVFTWVGVNFDSEQEYKHYAWIDIGEGIETHGDKGELQTRIYYDPNESIGLK